MPQPAQSLLLAGVMDGSVIPQSNLYRTGEKVGRAAVFALLVSVVPTVISALLGLILWLSWPAMGGLRRYCLQIGVQAKGMGWL